MEEFIEEKDFAVKYRVIRLEKNKYILYPIKLQKGELCGFDFVTEEEMVPILNRPKSMKEKYVTGAVYSSDDLRLLYGDFEDGKPDDSIDEKFLGEYFFNDSKEKIIYVETNDSKNKVIASKI